MYIDGASLKIRDKTYFDTDDVFFLGSLFPVTGFFLLI